MNDLIDKIMDNFDFHKVHEVMKFLNWEWGFTKNGVPEECEIRSFARSLLKESVDKDCDIESGGFKVINNEDILKLEFIITDWYEEKLA